MASIIDVARVAGVSQATVSRVLAGKDIVSAETREKVMEAVDELGYSPSSIGKALRSGRLDSVGFLVSDMEQGWYAALAKGLQQALQKNGQDMLLFDLGHSEMRLLQMMERAYALRLQAVVLAISDTFDFDRLKPALQRLEKARIPVVSVGQRLDHLGIGSVLHDEYSAGIDAVKHFHDRGRRRIAYLNRISQSVAGRRRYEGYLAGLEQAGHRPDERLIWSNPQYRFEGGYRAVQEAVDTGVVFDAILAGTDELAIGAMAALAERDRSVPGDVSVVGFGGLQVGRYTVPSLTTLEGNIPTVAQYVVETIASGRSETIFASRQLIVRDST